MTFAQKKQTPRDVIHRTLMRDAYTRIARGEVLMDGEWIAPEEVKHRRRRMRLSATGRLIETLVFQTIIALAGFGLLLLPVLLLV